MRRVVWLIKIEHKQHNNSLWKATKHDWKHSSSLATVQQKDSCSAWYRSRRPGERQSSCPLETKRRIKYQMNILFATLYQYTAPTPSTGGWQTIWQNDRRKICIMCLKDALSVPETRLRLVTIVREASARRSRFSALASVWWFSMKSSASSLLICICFVCSLLPLSLPWVTL